MACVYMCACIYVCGEWGGVYVCAHVRTQMISKFGVLRRCLATPQKQNEANSYENFLNINKSENL